MSARSFNKTNWSRFDSSRMCYPIQWEEKGGGGGGDLSKVMQGHTAEATQA